MLKDMDKDEQVSGGDRTGTRPVLLAALCPDQSIRVRLSPLAPETLGILGESAVIAGDSRTKTWSRT